MRPARLHSSADRAHRPFCLLWMEFPFFSQSSYPFPSPADSLYEMAGRIPPFLPTRTFPNDSVCDPECFVKSPFHRPWAPIPATPPSIVSFSIAPPDLRPTSSHSQLIAVMATISPQQHHHPRIALPPVPLLPACPPCLPPEAAAFPQRRPPFFFQMRPLKTPLPLPLTRTSPPPFALTPSSHDSRTMGFPFPSARLTHCLLNLLPAVPYRPGWLLHISLNHKSAFFCPHAFVQPGLFLFFFFETPVSRNASIRCFPPLMPTVMGIRPTSRRPSPFPACRFPYSPHVFEPHKPSFTAGSATFCPPPSFSLVHAEFLQPPTLPSFLWLSYPFFFFFSPPAKAIRESEQSLPWFLPPPSPASPFNS